MLSKIDTLMHRLDKELLHLDRSILHQYPIYKYIAAIYKQPSVGSYRYKLPEMAEINHAILYKYGVDVLCKYNAISMLVIMKLSIAKLPNLPFPEDIQQLCQRNYARILRNIEENRIDYMQFGNDQFDKDLSASHLHLIPAGPAKVHLNRYPRKFLINRGLRQFIDGITFAITELKGFSPLFEMHNDIYDPHAMGQFANRREVIPFYIRMAQLLVAFPEVKGVFGGSWLHDPALARISPKLYTIMRVPAINGGRIFYVGTSEQDIWNATLRSNERKTLYEQGRYMPTRYLLVWSRKSLISWSERAKYSGVEGCPSALLL